MMHRMLEPRGILRHTIGLAAPGFSGAMPALDMYNGSRYVKMEYGIWSLHAAGGLWGDPRLPRSHPILPPGAPQILPRVAAFALGALQPPPFAGSGPPYRAMELMSKASLTSVQSDDSEDPSGKSKSREDADSSPARKRSEDNESNVDKGDEDEDENENNSQTSVPSGSNDNEELDDDNDPDSSSDGSQRSANNNFSPKFMPDPMSCFGLEKEETGTPMLNGWVLGAYTAMLGRLSAATAALEASEVPNMPSDSDSESDHSSYTEKSRGSSPTAGSHCGYSCGSCDTVAPTRPALRKHILESHLGSSSSESSGARRCPSSGCEFTSNSRCEMESHVAAHVAQGMTPTGKKRSLALQRVRYEREEYRCSLCSYACTIEKAFQRHLRAHARGSAPETRVSCAVCGADRSSEVDLSRHMRRHRDDRYFCCDICVFRTVQLKKLIQHRRMHTGEKPHLCPHCAYRSARRDNLRSHVRRVHKKENLYCDTFSPRGMLIGPTSIGPESPSVTTTLVHSPASSPSSTTGTNDN